MAHDVFISHATKDRKVADAICSALETQETRCWVAPRDVPPGAEWAASIVDAIRASDVMVMVFSSHSNHSEHVRRELTIAADAGAVIVPVKIDDTPLEGLMEYYLADKHWLDAMNPPTKAQIAALATTVRTILAARKGMAPVLSQDAAPTEVPGGRTNRFGRRLAVGVSLIVALTGLAIATYTLLSPSASREAATPEDSLEDLPAYGDVVDSLPIGSSVVALEARILGREVFLNGQEVTLVDFLGHCEGVEVLGAFYLTNEGMFDPQIAGSRGVYWMEYGGTEFLWGEQYTWEEYRASLDALAAADEKFAALRDDTRRNMTGARFTSSVSGTFGQLEVGPGDRLTFDAGGQLVKVSSW